MFGRLMAVAAFYVGGCMIGSAIYALCYWLTHPGASTVACSLIPFLVGISQSVAVVVFCVIWEMVRPRRG